MTKPETVVLGFADYRACARALAECARLDYADIELHRFPDGESKLQLPVDLPAQIVICQTLDRPNHKLVELMLAAAAAREQGVSRIILVAPYLCYMRQDTAFHPGEVVSQKVIGSFLADYFDAVITVDAHLHRISTLSQAIPLHHALNLDAAEAMGQFIRDNCGRPVLIGPDAESEQWVVRIAAYHRLDYCIARKHRHGDRDVQVSLPQYRFQNRDVVIIDDVASTGTTLEMAARQLPRREVASISALVTHALFVDDACARLQRAGVGQIWSCDSILHSSNRISLAPVLAAGLRQLLDAGG